MVELSVCMIVKDEALMIEGCLESVQGIADEIIVVDTGSTDNTIQIAKSFNAKVFHFKWQDDFSAARNEAIRHATGKWIFFIDADERLQPADARAIRKLITLDFDAFTLIQRNYTNDAHNINFHPLQRPENGFIGFIPVEVVRLFRNDGYYYKGRVHELVDDSLKENHARVGLSDALIHHFELLKGIHAVSHKQEKYLKYSLQSLKERPDDEKLLLDISLIYLHHLKDLAHAEKHLREALKHHPRSARAHMLMGQLLVVKGEIAEAIEVYRRLLVFDTEHRASIYYNLGELFLASDDREQARAAYEAALRHGSHLVGDIKRRLSQLAH